MENRPSGVLFCLLQAGSKDFLLAATTPPSTARGTARGTSFMADYGSHGTHRAFRRTAHESQYVFQGV
jgi:hypothetical protein